MAQTVDRYAGNDNYGKPKQAYLDKIAAMTIAELGDECEKKIWLSAFAANNPRSDYHWHVDACYDECNKRERLDIYKAAYNRAVRTM